MEMSSDTYQEHQSDASVEDTDGEAKELTTDQEKPYCIPISRDTIRVKWETLPDKSKAIEVQYKPLDAEKWSTVPLTDDECILDIPGLVEDIYFHFRLKLLCDNQEFFFSKISEPVSTLRAEQVYPTNFKSSGDIEHARPIDDNSSDKSEPEVFIPPVIEPNVSISLQGRPVCEVLNSETIKVSWEQSPDIKNDLQYYEVRYKDVSEEIKRWESITTPNCECSITISDLDDRKGYYFKVRAIFDDVEGPFTKTSSPFFISSVLPFEKHDQPVELQITETTSKSLLIKWGLPLKLSGEINCYEMKFKTTNLDVKRWQSKWTKSTETEIIINDLDDNTEYVFKVRAMVDGEDGPFSESVIGKTNSKDNRPGSPRKTASSPYSISINWENPNNATKDVCTHFDVRYRATNYGKRWFAESVDSSLTELTISGLNPNTQYEVKVREVHSETEGPFSETSYISTEALTFDSTGYLDVVVQSTDETSITLTWKQQMEDEGRTDHFEIRYKEGNGKWCSQIVGGNENQCILEGLTPSTLYHVKMRSVIDGFDHPFINLEVMTIPSESYTNDTKIELPVVVEATTDSIEVKWKPPVYEPKSIMHYEVRYQSCSQQREEWETGHTKECAMTICNLDSATDYEIKIRAIYAEKIGAFSDTIRLPTKPVNVDVIVLEEQEVSFEYISLFWEKPKVDKEVEEYHVSYRQIPKGKWAHLSTEERQVTVSNLLEGIDYEFRIRAIFDDTEGPASPSRIITTLKVPEHEKNRKPGVPIQKDTSFDTISIGWQIPTDTNELGYYEIKYRAHLTDNWVRQTSTENTTTLLGLDQSTSYNVKVRGIYEDSFGHFSDEGQVKTISEDEMHKNESPTVPEAVNIGYCRATIKWTESASWKKEIDRYKVQCARKDDIENQEFQYTHYESATNDISLNALDMSVAYRFRVLGVFVDQMETPFSEWSDFILTSKCVIEDLKVSSIAHDSFSISWKRPHLYDEIVDYEIMFRENLDGIEEWQSIKTRDNKVVVDALKDSTEYDLQLRCILSCGQKSECFPSQTQPTTLLHPEKKYPGQPYSSEATTRSISLTWTPCKLKRVGGHEIKYRECGTETKKWISVFSDTYYPYFNVKNLRNGTDYEFKVAAIIDGDTKQFSKVSHKISTKLSLARKLQLDTKAVVETGPPMKFKLPVICTTENKAAKTRKCEIDHRLLRPHKGSNSPLQRAEKFIRRVNNWAHSTRNPVGPRERTIMLVGATGAGKSTLIDGMINYVTDVSWEDDFRFTLVELTDDEKKKLGDQTVSQTDWITTYKIPCISGGKLDYTINIVDTPGFGDTRGITRDKELVSQLKDLFESKDENGIQMLDGVCFVTQSPLARLTPPQQYIFDSMLSLFGKDIADNIFILITFADGKKPPVIDALKKAQVPFNYYCKFNNSALFGSNQSDGEFSQMFWKMGEESFEKFFNHVRAVDSKSLQLTAEVLRTRSLLEVTIEGLQRQVTDGMIQLNTIIQEGEVLKRHKSDIKNNTNFNYEVEEAVICEVKLSVGEYVTNCLNCNISCHYPCRIETNEDKNRCKAMGKTDHCKVCPQKCHWTKHRNAGFRLETKKQTVTKTYAELQKKFEIAKTEATNQEKVLQKVKSKFGLLRNDVNKKIKAVRKCVNDLDQFALRPNPLSDIDYIDLLITSEEHEMKYDWENRVKLLKDFKAEAQMIKDVKTGNLEPFKGTDEILRTFDINYV